MTAEERVLILEALSIATGHWSNKGSKHEPWSDERDRCYEVADEFRALREKLLREAL